MGIAEAFNGRSVLVTGAASGIGRSIAAQTTEVGAKVLLVDKSEKVFDVAAEIGRGAEAILVDVREPQQLKAAVDRVVELHGRLDFMFNNAGVAIFGEIEETPIDEWDLIIDVNFRAVAHGMKFAWDQMIRQPEGGHIVSTASAAGLVPVPLQTHYVGTKHGVVGLSKNLSLEGAEHNIHATVFCPGFTETGMMTDNIKHGRMDIPDIRKLAPAPPTPVDVQVERLLKGVARRRRYVVVPFYSRLGWWVERISPSFSHQVHRVIHRITLARAKRAGRGGRSRD